MGDGTADRERPVDQTANPSIGLSRCARRASSTQIATQELEDLSGVHATYVRRDIGQGVGEERWSGEDQWPNSRVTAKHLRVCAGPS